jgi:prepilin-type N-terminal cleavage/methylation domain-containing protein
MCAVRKTTRRGFTLIELMVVMGIIILLAVLGYMVLPPLSADNNRVRTLDALSEYLLTAKMRAKRDGLATGIRLLGAPGTVSTLAYVQQPDLITGTTMGASLISITPGTSPAPSSAAFTGGDWIGAGTTAGDSYSPVQPGDYLEVLGGGPAYLITALAQTTVAGVTTTTLSLLNSNASYSATLGATSNWRILRQPRLLQGEDVKQLPGTYGIDMSAGKSLNVPLRSFTSGTTTTTYYEILFSPSGSVVGTGTTAGKIVLWVSDFATVTQPGPSGLIAINIRTGFIGAYDVNPNGTDPYSFTEDGRSGGI